MPKKHRLPHLSLLPLFGITVVVLISIFLLDSFTGSKFQRKFLLYILPFSPQFQQQHFQRQKVARQAGEVVNPVSLASEVVGANILGSQIVPGCPHKDCLPSLDEPFFEPVESADHWLEGDNRVFVLTYNGITKIYPQRILNWHEIVNDWVGNEPIALTFDPLSGSSMAFSRTINQKITQLGVSGKLYNSNLLT